MQTDSFFEDVQEKDIEHEDNGLFAFDCICLGGTFDHMHLGHRLLLTQAALVTKKKLFCGVTSDILLSKKVHSDLIEPFEKRKQSVIDFLNALNPHLEVNVFELCDPVGVAGTSTEAQACVLTREVEKGGVMINEAREKNGLGPLKMVYVDMVVVESEKEDQPK
eukprot:CAMPEP_0176370984 /NCGR_PEP_ID=MMETSP0126-20121128/24380_1 /TAXON_ID=141414 ORGANISM="Strombidinopsis acuminatum, Strain SPMC142" /NCGR_SAMPLE_ID=MMETSP0126 /ASSEMBLY_ACC=CAM_ASM_000229 /LENGTH=163 /DNA_ID=CAMNT_0017730259 /DNA_START=427 /DNA_END=916 /DNA_ORIENTATION=-